MLRRLFPSSASACTSTNLLLMKRRLPTTLARFLRSGRSTLTRNFNSSSSSDGGGGASTSLLSFSSSSCIGGGRGIRFSSVVQRPKILIRSLTTTKTQQQQQQDDDDDDDDDDDSKAVVPLSRPLPTQRVTGIWDTSVWDTPTDGDMWRGFYKSAGQVIFVDSNVSGSIILLGLTIGDPFLGMFAFTGMLGSTLLASACSEMMDRDALYAGLWSYNGCLVGCATAAFVVPLHPTIIHATVTGQCTVVEAGPFAAWLSTAMCVSLAGAATSTVVAWALSKGLEGKMPQWTFAFNIVTLAMLMRPWGPPKLQPRDIDTAMAELDMSTLLPPDIAAATTWDAALLLNAPLKGLSQIFLVESSLSGLIIVSGIVLYSPLLAVHGLAGSAAGAATGWWLCGGGGGPAMADVASGLWSYNSALVSMGVGAFFVPTPASAALSLAGAAGTAVLFGTMQSLFGDVPCLTLPFCFAMSGCYLLADTVPGLSLKVKPQSPERDGTEQKVDRE